MKICGSKAAVGLALLWGFLLAVPGAGQAQTASYLDHDGLTRELRSIANGSNLATMESLGTTLGGREIWVVTVGNGSGTPLSERPGILVVGNLEGDHLVGSQLALEAIRYLVMHAQEEAVQAALTDHVFYFFPRLNPDGAEAMFARVKWDRKTNTRPFDDDHDRRVDEDGPEDLNGDGYVTVMRAPDPSGAYMIDPENDRLMKTADPTKGETGAYTLYWEGTDEDGDGFINEDGSGGVDLNRNFQHAYPYWQPDAGPHMVSEVESRALMDFTLSHRNIGAILTFGESDNLVVPPDARGGLAGAKVPDLPLFAARVERRCPGCGSVRSRRGRVRMAAAGSADGAVEEGAYTSGGHRLGRTTTPAPAPDPPPRWRPRTWSTTRPSPKPTSESQPSRTFRSTGPPREPSSSTAISSTAFPPSARWAGGSRPAVREKGNGQVRRWIRRKLRLWVGPGAAPGAPEGCRRRAP